MVGGFAITFIGILQLLGIVAAFMLGRQTERPKAKWPTGSLVRGGWQAWRVPMIIIVAVAAGATVFLPILAEVGIGNLLGFGGGGRGRGGVGRGRGGVGRGGGGFGGGSRYMYD